MYARNLSPPLKSELCIYNNIHNNFYNLSLFIVHCDMWGGAHTLWHSYESRRTTLWSRSSSSTSSWVPGPYSGGQSCVVGVSSTEPFRWPNTPNLFLPLSMNHEKFKNIRSASNPTSMRLLLYALKKDSSCQCWQEPGAVVQIFNLRTQRQR